MPTGPAAAERGLLDTSIFIAQESGRALGTLPTAAAISVVTVAELHLGVLMADRSAARAFAEIVAEARRHGRRPKIMDTWIAATAITHGLPVYTQDDDFATIPGIQVFRI